MAVEMLTLDNVLVQVEDLVVEETLVLVEVVLELLDKEILEELVVELGK